MKEHRVEPILKLVTPSQQSQLCDKALISGVESLSDAELLAVFINPDNGKTCSLEFATKMLAHYGDLRAVLNTDFRDVDEIFHIQLQAGKEISRRSDFIDVQKEGPFSLNQIQIFLKRRMRDYKNEVNAAIFLDANNKVIAYEELFFGTINSATVYIRVIIERILFHNARSIIWVHNHPSGETRPSDADIAMTNTIKDALRYIDCRLLDHIIVGDNEVYSIITENRSICN